MRCKNCGSENEENLYICQNCGSPLYDENEPADNTNDDNGATRIVPVVQPAKSQPVQPKPPVGDEDDSKKKQQTIIIAVLAIVLAVAIGVLAGVLIHNNGTKDEETTVPTSTTELSTKPSTTQPTTEATTTTTTEVKKHKVSVSCRKGGMVDGAGEYEEYDKCTVTARASSGFEFDGWYENGKLVSNSPSYAFVVMNDVSLEAVFNELGNAGQGEETSNNE